MGGRDDGQIKLHRRTLVLDGRSRTVLSPRPSDGFRFADNLYHDEWHVLSDHAGGRMFGRLLWAMAAQPADVLLVIDPQCLVPNPFDADPSLPVVIAARRLGGSHRRLLDDLSRSLPFRTPSLGTVKVRTAGVDAARDAERAWSRGEASPQARPSWDEPAYAGFVDVHHGLLLMAATPPMLRAWATSCLGLADDDEEEPEAYAELDFVRPDHGYGRAEIQTFASFALYCEQARTVRDACFPAARNRMLTDEERGIVWQALPSRPRS